MKRLFLCVCAAVLLTGCALFPKEEELTTTPIIEVYQQEEFKMAEVQRGELKHYETIDVVTQMINETQLSFPFDDMSYEGFYVRTGDPISEGQVLAKLSASGKEQLVGDSSELTLTAPYDGIVVYARDIEEGEKSVSGQVVLILNQSDTFILSAFTPYWDRFEIGQNYLLHYAGEDYQMTAVDAETIGITPAARPEGEDEPSRVYFTVQAPGLLLQSGQQGEVTILLEQKEDVLYIPASAITVVNDEEIVYVENADGIRSTQKVTTGMRANEYVEIVDGLSEGDKVILE